MFRFRFPADNRFAGDVGKAYKGGQGFQSRAGRRRHNTRLDTEVPEGYRRGEDNDRRRKVRSAFS